MGILFRKPSPEKAAEIVSKLEEKRLRALEASEAAQNEFNSASLLAVDGGQKEQAAVSQARIYRDKKVGELADIEGTLEAARRQYSAALQKHEALRIADIKRKKREAIDKLRGKAKTLEERVDALYSLSKEVKDLGLEAHKLAMESGFPQREIVNGLLLPNRVDNYIRNYLYKVGFGFAYEGSLLTPHQMPTLSDTLTEACNWLCKYDDGGPNE